MRVWMQRSLLAPEAFPLAALIVALVVFATLSPYFLTPSNLSQLVTDNLEVAIIALAVAPLVIVREIDLSVGSIVGLTAVAFGSSTTAGLPWPVAALLALLVGVAAGLLNGIIVTRFGLSSIVVTLGSMALYRGLANVIIADQTIVGFPEAFAGWDLRYLPGTVITVAQVIFVVVAIVVALGLGATTGGRRVYTLGSSPGVAAATAVRVNRLKVVLFALSGLASGVAGLVLTSRLQSVRADTGEGLELLVLTVVLLGGVSILGGRGSIAGVLVAVVLVGTIRSGMALAGYPDQARIAVIGLLLLLSIAANVLLRRAQERTRRRRAVQSLTRPLDQETPPRTKAAAP